MTAENDRLPDERGYLKKGEYESEEDAGRPHGIVDGGGERAQVAEREGQPRRAEQVRQMALDAPEEREARHEEHTAQTEQEHKLARLEHDERYVQAGQEHEERAQEEARHEADDALLSTLFQHTHTHTHARQQKNTLITLVAWR